MRNPLAELKTLLGTPPLQIGTVTAVSGSNITVQLPGGGLLTVRGEAVVGNKVYVRNGAIEGPAPNLPVFTITI